MLSTGIGTLTFSPSVLAAPVDPPKLSWYATGDSYSAGTGADDDKGKCHRSPVAWAPAARNFLANTRGVSFGEFVFTACHGAVVSDEFIAKGSGTENQSHYQNAVDKGLPSGGFDVVSFSFSGNDLDFSEILLDCMRFKFPSLKRFNVDIGDDCDVTERQLNKRVADLSDATGHGEDRNEGRFVIDDGKSGNVGKRVHGSMATFYRTMLDRLVSPTGNMFVLGYPRLFAPSKQWGLSEGFRCHGITRGDANMLGRVAKRLDAKLREQVAEADAGRGRIHYVGVDEMFAEGGKSRSLCGDGANWLHGVTLSSGGQDSFHPNTDGYRAEAKRVADLMVDQLTCPLDSRCLGRLRTDIDGDRKADQVGLSASSTSSSRGQQRLRVAWGGGGTTEVRVPANRFDGGLIGVADLNGVAGDEIVLSPVRGAHTQAIQLVTAVDRELRLVSTDADGLVIDRSVMTAAGVSCSGVLFGLSEPRLTSRVVQTDAAGDFTGIERVYRWDSDRLVTVTTKELSYPGESPTATRSPLPPEVRNLSGIDCLGLPSGFET